MFPTHTSCSQRDCLNGRTNIPSVPDRYFSSLSCEKKNDAVSWCGVAVHHSIRFVRSQVSGSSWTRVLCRQDTVSCSLVGPCLLVCMFYICTLSGAALCILQLANPSRTGSLLCAKCSLAHHVKNHICLFSWAKVRRVRRDREEDVVKTILFDDLHENLHAWRVIKSQVINNG